MPASHPLNGSGNRSAYMGRTEYAAWGTGVVFVVIGAFGLIGHLFGSVEVPLSLNAIHLVYGVAGIVVTRTFAGARNYLIGGGIVYLALGARELTLGSDGSASTALPGATVDWIRLGLAVAMIALGAALNRTSEPRHRLVR